MSIQQTGSFRDLKEILAADADVGDSSAVSYEIQERAHVLCSKFIGGIWKSIPVSDIHIARMKGGMSNMLFICQIAADSVHRLDMTFGEPDKTLLRVYFNPETESHLVAESVIFTLLSERQLGPQLYGIFNGGRLEEYIVSRPLTCPEIRREEISMKIAKKLARIHKLNVPISKEPTYLCEALERWLKHLVEIAGCIRPYKIPLANDRECIITKQILLWEIDMMSWIERMQLTRPDLTIRVPMLNCVDKPDQLDKVRLVDLDDLMANFCMIRRAMERSLSPIVFCHNDLQEGNILLPKDSHVKDLVIIDFEYASYNYRAFDFANHFCEWAINYGLEEAPHFLIKWDDFPTVEQQTNFIKTYIDEVEKLQIPCSPSADQFLSPDRPPMTSKQRRNSFLHISPGLTEKETLAQIREEVESFVPVSHFLWGVWAMLQVELSPVKFGFAEYAVERLKWYFKLRPNLVRLISRKDSKISEVFNASANDIVEKCRDSPQ